MIPFVTPRIEAALDRMTRDEIIQLDDAVTANLEKEVLQMLYSKDFLIAFEQDPILGAMMNFNVSWADLMDAMPNSAKRVLEYKEVDPDADWEMPQLRLRKHIWENFPVDVVPVESKDRAERYAIRWNVRKFQEARNNCDHGWQYDDFEEDVYRRLLKALSYSRYWTVEEAQGSNICQIAMNFQEDTMPAKAFKLPVADVNDAASVCSAVTNASSDWETVSTKTTVPTLRRLNDIKALFPVIWNPVEGCKSTTYAVEIFGKKVKELGLNANKVKTDLLVALKASKSWTVLPGNDRAVCLLQMNHA